MKINDALAIPASSQQKSSALICTKCEQSKLPSDFYTKGQRRDSCCKKCVSKAKAVQYKRKQMVQLKQARQQERGPRIISSVIGSLDQSAIEKAASILGESIWRLENVGEN